MDLLKKVKDKFEFRNGFNAFKQLSKKKKFMIIIVVVLIIALVSVVAFGKRGKKEETEKAYIEVQAAVGNITETIEQSGVVEPYERYEITALVKGEIIASPFEEGDQVKEGDTLYQIDDEDAQLNMEKAQMSLEEATENVTNLNIYAPASGRLTDFNIKLGDNIGSSVIGKINNTDKLPIDIPFSTEDFNKISVGDRVTATSALYMTTLSGTVTHKYTAPAGSGTEGSITRNIEIEIDNPGALSEGTTFAATVHTGSGDVNSAGSGVIEGGTTTSLRAEVSGEVSYIGVKNGDYVSKGQLIAKLSNKALVNSQKSSRLNVKSNQKTLDNYNITAPISGTVITKNSKAGDKLDNTNASKVMMVVADMSKMKFTITVDELDIADIKLGQTAIVQADAIADTAFEAKVTTIASEGVSSGDGVTTFNVELTIDEPGELKSGMNVNANILINEAHNVLTIPEDALMSVRGSNASVLVKTEEGKKTERTKTKNNENKNEKNDFKPKIPSGGNNNFAPPSGQNQSPNANNKTTNNKNGGMNFSNAAKGNSNVPDGYEIRQVVIGISDGTNIEIISGLSEGETVAYIPTTSSSGNPFMRMMMGGRMPGSMMGGGSRTGSNRMNGSQMTGRR